MCIKEFSDESVRHAVAANTLCFDVVDKYEKTTVSGACYIPAVRLVGVNRSLEVSNQWFPELELRDSISLLYIIHSRDITKFVKCSV